MELKILSLILLLINCIFGQGQQRLKAEKRSFDVGYAGSLVGHLGSSYSQSNSFASAGSSSYNQVFNGYGGYGGYSGYPFYGSYPGYGAYGDNSAYNGYNSGYLGYNSGYGGFNRGYGGYSAYPGYGGFYG